MKHIVPTLSVALVAVLGSATVLAAESKPAAKSGMPRWQDRLFISLTRTANDATDYFQIPTGRVVEVGTQVTV